MRPHSSDRDQREREREREGHGVQCGRSGGKPGKREVEEGPGPVLALLAPSGPNRNGSMEICDGISSSM